MFSVVNKWGSAKLFAGIVSVLMLVNCSASGPEFKQLKKVSEDVATIYIYRPWLTYNMVGYPYIYINDEKAFALTNGGYGVIKLKPGKHDIRAEGSKALTDWFPMPVSFTFDYKGGREYFLRVIPKFKDSMVVGSAVAVSGTAQIALIPKNAALEEISETNKVNETKVIK